MINCKIDDLNNWNKLFDSKCDEENEVDLIMRKPDDKLSIRRSSAAQNITLQVNGEEEEKFFISTNNLNVNNETINMNNSLKLNHDNGLSQSCLSLNQFDLPSSTQLSLDSLSSDNCIHAEAGRLFHQQLDKELSKVIPTSQRKASVETVHNRYRYNKRRKKNSVVSNNMISNQVKQFNNPTNSDHLTYSPPSNCPFEPLLSNSDQRKPSIPFQNQFDQLNLLDPSTARSIAKDSHSVQSIFTQQSTNLLKPPNFTSGSKTDTSNLSTNTTKNGLNLMGSSNLNLKADLTPTNLRRRCIAKNGVANIRNAKISRKSQRFFLDFFNTMIDIEWHYNLLAFTLSFVISWLFFAVIWWSIAYQHGDLYRIEELDEVAVDLDKMNANLNFLAENIENLNTENVLSKTKRSISFDDEDKILNKLAYSILQNRTTIQQLIEHFNLSKLRLNSTSGTNIFSKMEDGTNITNFLSYLKNNPNLKQTFANHNVSLNKISKLVQPKPHFLNDTDQTRSLELNDLKQLNNGDQSIIQHTNPEVQQQLDQSSIIMNTVQTNDEHLPQFPIANLTVDQRHQLENLFYLMQLQNLLQQERNKQQIAKFLTKLAKKAHQSSLQAKPSHPPEQPPSHPIGPDTQAIQVIEAQQEEHIQKEIEAKHKEKLNTSKNHLPLNETIQLNGSQTIPEQEIIIQNLKPNPVGGGLPSPDAVIEDAVLKASESILPRCGVNGTKSCRKVCLDNINSFADALLFSIETQHTIGYGTRQPAQNDGNCKIVLVVLMVQSIFGCLIQCFVVGFVFAKLSRPQMRHQTLVFSKRAVINLSEYDHSYDFTSDTHTDNQFNLNFEELNDLVNLMKSGEMQEMMQDCCCTTNSETSSDQTDAIRRQSTDAISTDDDLLNQNNYFNQLKDNLLNIPSSKRCSNVSFLNIGNGTLQSKVSNNLKHLYCETDRHTVDYTGNKNYRLEFRLGDVRDRSHIIGARISAYFLSKENYCFKNDLMPKSNRSKYQLFKKRRSEVDYSNLRLNSTLNTTKTYNYNELVMEKKLHTFTQKKLALTIDNVEHSDGELLLIWPIVVTHQINECSPLYNISRDEILNSKFEIVIVLEGTIESTGQSVQARTSYLPSEILWGERFVPVLQSDNEDAEFLVNFSMFNMTQKQSMPSFSSREYQTRKKFHKLLEFKKYLSKLSDAEINVDETNLDTNATNLCSNNLNLLRHLLNQNDKHNLNGLITNMDDLNNLRNLLDTLNKLVNSNGASSSNSANGNTNLFRKHSCNNNQLNLGNQFMNANANLDRSLNQFYQQSLSVDQAAMSRKKSTELSNLLDLLQNSQIHNKTEHKSRSINFLNNLNMGNNLANNINMSHSMNNQISPMSRQQSNHSNTSHNQKDLFKKPLPPPPSIKRNDSEHITIEDDLLKVSHTPERTKTSNLKLMSLFQPSINSPNLGFNNSNYDANYKPPETDNQNLVTNNDSIDRSNPKSNHTIRQLKNQNSKFKTTLCASPERQTFGRSESHLAASATQNSTYLMALDDNNDWRSKSDWNLAAASRKRQTFKSTK